uniref:Uncharacterized protein n=1 Tax=Gopherus agassizii TaxID=38772 RepID=A0A452H5Q9_9SAUR
MGCCCQQTVVQMICYTNINLLASVELLQIFTDVIPKMWLNCSFQKPLFEDNTNEKCLASVQIPIQPMPGHGYAGALQHCNFCAQGSLKDDEMTKHLKNSPGYDRQRPQHSAV